MLLFGLATTLVATSVNALTLPTLTSISTPSPTVSLDYANYSGSSSNGINSFLGMRFAEAPVGELRYNRPVFPPSNQGSAVIPATSYSKGCIAQQLTDGAADGIPSSVSSLSLLSTSIKSFF